MPLGDLSVAIDRAPPARRSAFALANQHTERLLHPTLGLGKSPASPRPSRQSSPSRDHRRPPIQSLMKNHRKLKALPSGRIAPAAPTPPAPRVGQASPRRGPEPGMSREKSRPLPSFSAFSAPPRASRNASPNRRPQARSVSDRLLLPTATNRLGLEINHKIAS